MGKEKEGYQTFNLRKYELTNHLGNVLAVISDKVNLYGHDNRLDSARATAVSASDYYPFGLPMKGRTFDSADYRFGFNGKEKDNPFVSAANYDYGFRIYDPSKGRFLSVDPLFKDYPWNSTYAFAENDVIRSIDLDGLEKYYTTDGKYIGTSIANKSPNSIRMVTSSTTSKDGNKQYIHGFKEIKFNDSKTELVKMWTDASSDNKERTGYIIFDSDKADIGKTEGLENGATQKVTDRSNFDRQYSDGGDGKTAEKRGARHTIGGTNVDYYSPKGKAESKNNITTRDNLLKGKFNISKDAFFKRSK